MASDFSWSSIFGDRLLSRRDGKVVQVSVACVQSRALAAHASKCVAGLPRWSLLGEEGSPGRMVAHAQVPSADLSGKHVGIYFSAHW